MTMEVRGIPLQVLAFVAWRLLLFKTFNNFSKIPLISSNCQMILIIFLLGLTLLLPYIISTRRNWSSCKLRVFTLANKFDELECEHRNMASLLAKFRIDYSDLQVVPDITSKALDSTQQFFDTLIADFRRPVVEGSNNGEHAALNFVFYLFCLFLVVISEAELLAVKEKTNRHLRLRELLLQHSNEASLVVMTLPIPRKNIISAPLYMAWLELLTRDMPPILLVRGNQTSVLTFYS